MVASIDRISTTKDLGFRLSQPLYELACLFVKETYYEIDTITNDEHIGHPDVFKLWSDNDLCASINFELKVIYLYHFYTTVSFEDAKSVLEFLSSLAS